MNLEHCTFVDKSHIGQLVQGCRYLIEINLNNCYQIYDSSIQILTEHYQLLSISLDVTNVTDDALFYLSQRCPNLKVLSLDHCEISDTSNEYIVLLSNLRSLNVSHTPITYLSLYPSITTLESLNISNCRVLTTITHLWTNHNLYSLNLFQCPLGTDLSFLKAITVNLRNLETFYVGDYGVIIPDDLLIEFVTLPKIENLYIYGTELTQEAKLIFNQKKMFSRYLTHRPYL